MNRDEIVKYWNNKKNLILKDLITFLSIPSISTDLAYNAECINCAKWLANHLDQIGFKTKLIETATKPLLFAELIGDASKPSVLFYGHYDVQPVDPIELWTSPPFKPEIRGERIYARGAQDNKGQLFYFIKAVEYLKSQGITLPTIKLLIEGEEESGSAALQEIDQPLQDLIKAQILMVCDTGALQKGMPTIIAGLRGIISFEVKITGAKNDLHSGVFGGVVVNPAQAACQLVASFHNADGSVAVEGFYQTVPEPTVSERELANSLSTVLLELEEQIGSPFIGGEKRFSTLERRSFRPTLEINGVGSGYQGEGGKTIIPNSATIKFTTRLAYGQDPETVVKQIKHHIERHAIKGVSTELTGVAIGGPAMKIPLDNTVINKARSVIKSAFAKEAVLMWEGASIPIIPKILSASGASIPLLVGFGLEEDKIHAPDESFSIEQFQDGMLFVSAFLSV